MPQQISIFAENKPGKIERISGILGRSGVNMRAITIADSGDYGIIKILADRPVEGCNALKADGIAATLKEAGVVRYHCNLEASRGYFPQVCTTHTWAEKVETLGLARAAGMTLCSGGIIGMGEQMTDRIDMAFELRELEVTSIPINILTPIPGTPLAELAPLSVDEVLTTVALFRFINPEAVIRMAGGRQQLGDDQYRCFAAGANGAIVGNYLTTTGAGIKEDLERVSAMGFTFDRG